jgi:ankyrin repeat protein
MTDPEHRDGAGRTLLHYAAMANDVARVHELIASSAEVDAADTKGFTPLHLAAQEHAVDAARALSGGGATVDARNEYGNTPLFVATANSRGLGEMIHLLLELGADPDALNNYGQTPRGLAELIGNYDVKQFYEE